MRENNERKDKMLVESETKEKRKMLSKRKKSMREKGITLIALVVTIIILLILAGVAIASVTGDNGLFRKAKEAVNIYKDSEKEESDALDYITTELDGIINQRPTVNTEPTNEMPTFSTDYGRVDVVWLNGNSNTVATSANEPNLYTGENSLKPVTWSKDGENWKEDTTSQTTWYDYSEANRYWANAKNSDESYFVWIPRYAYRITYYSDPECTKVTGYYDGYGMYDAINGTLNYKVDEGIETVYYNKTKYIVHPAFTGIGKEENGGGFGVDANGITGLWVAKFGTSKETSSDNGNSWILETTSNSTIGNVTITNSNKNSIRAVSKPYRADSQVSCWRNISIGNMYLNAYNYDRNKESHLMKNSEWGAVAYLTHSKYGRNGQEVTINNNNSYYTGIAGTTVSAPSSSDATNAFETKAGTLASTTGNVYGIYDMSGGAYEYMSCFDKASTSPHLTSDSSGKLMIDAVPKDAGGNYISSKYVTVYTNGTDDYSSREAIFSVGKIGDATKEVRKSTNSNSWNEDVTGVVYQDRPFCLRCGDYNYNLGAGVFFSNVDTGIPYKSRSFRLVLA